MTETSGRHIADARAWLATYYINFLAVIGPIIGSLTLYRLFSLGELQLWLLPISLALLPWPLIAWFKRQIPINVQMILVAGFFMMVTLLVTINAGLHSHIMLVGVISVQVLMLFYGKRGLWAASFFLLGLLACATLYGMVYGHVPAVKLDSSASVFFRGITMSLLAFSVIYSTYGVISIFGAQALALDAQATTIDLTTQDAKSASESLELLEETIDCILLTVQPDGLISYLNRYAKIKLGSIKGALFIKDITANEDDRLKFMEALGRASSTMRTSRFNCQLVSSDDAVLSVQVTCTRRQLNDGHVDLVCVAHNVTRLVEQQERILKAEKFEALGEACARISHDFANLLTVISGNINFLKDSGLDETSNEILADIEDAAKDSKELTEQIGQYSAKQRIEAHIVDMADFNHRLTSMAKSLCPEEISVKTNASFSNDFCWFDETVLTSIVLNLVANARDAIEGKGSIVINTALSDQHKETERTLTISIKDDGQGIKEEHLEKVFEPFFSTKSSHKGLGLGLSTVVRQLDAMAGELEVDSKIGEGTTMTIRLPVSIEPEKDAAHVHSGV